jgi:hypothetical protein
MNDVTVAVFGCALVMTGTLTIMVPQLRGIHLNKRLANTFLAAGGSLVCIGVAALFAVT